MGSISTPPPSSTPERSRLVAGHNFNALSFVHVPGGVPTSLSAATTPVLRFWVNGGAGSGQQFHIGLQNGGVAVGSSAALDTYIAGGGFAAGVSLARSRSTDAGSVQRRQFRPHRHPERCDAVTTAPTAYFDDMVLGQVSVAPVSTIQIDHDVTVASMVSDRFTWQDSLGHPRVASLAHNDGLRSTVLRRRHARVQISVVERPDPDRDRHHLRQRRLRRLRLRDAALQPVRRMRGRRFSARQGYAGIGSGLRRAPSRHLPLHAELSAQLSDDGAGRHARICPSRSTGYSPPAATTRCGPSTTTSISSPSRGNSRLRRTYYDDSRGPYGEFAIDGEGFTNLNGVSWGDRYKFITTNAAGTGTTLDSPWSWTAANTVPFVKEWLDGPLTGTNTQDATMGIVQTQTMTSRMRAERAIRNRQRHPRLLGQDGRRQRAHRRRHKIPDGNNWPYQAYGNSLDFEYPGASNNARMTWKTQFGFIGQTTYTTNNGGPNTTAPGYPKKSYSTYVVLGQHSTVPEPVDAQVAQVEAIQSLTLSAVAPGSVVTSGPAGITRADNVTYAPAGYNHVTARWRSTLPATRSMRTSPSAPGR